MPSKAYAGLNARLKDVDQLMAAHRAVAGPKKGRKYEVEGLNRAAVLMLSAHFEGYLEDLMEESLGALNQKLDVRPLVRSFANPQPKKIDGLFAFLGMKKPSKQVKWQKASNATVLKYLNRLIETRNQLAHGKTGVKVSKRDVVQLRRYVEGFAKRFDGLTRERVKALTGKAPWPT